MKAPVFDLIRAEHLDQVFELLAQYGDEARILAGGQTLLATLNMRLSEPSVLIDINALDDLRHISVGTNCLTIGARTTHSDIEDSTEIGAVSPLLHLAVSHIAHRAIRNRGTWGGSLAYADPAAEWPACALALDGTVLVANRRGKRRIAVKDFFLGLYTTALEPDEIVIGTELRTRQEAGRVSFAELARRHGDYAIAGLAATASLQHGALKDVRIAFLGIAAIPFRAERCEAFLEGQPVTDRLVEEVTEMLRTELTGPFEPIGDLTNSVALKRQLAGVLLARGLGTLARSPERLP